MPRFRRNACLIFVVILLLLTAWLGMVEGSNGYRSARTSGQHVAAVTQLSYGAAAVLCLVALYLRARWAPAALTAWVVTLTATATLAPIVWADAGILSGLLAGMATAAVAGLASWCARASLRRSADSP